MLPDVDAEERQVVVSAIGESWFGGRVDGEAGAVVDEPRPAGAEALHAGVVQRLPSSSSRPPKRVGDRLRRARRRDSPPPSGPMISQKSEWFACPPALLRTGGLLVLGERVEVGRGRARPGCPRARCPVERLVRVVDVRLVVLVVVEAHRLLVDRRLRARRSRREAAGPRKPCRAPFLASAARLTGSPAVRYAPPARMSRGHARVQPRGDLAAGSSSPRCSSWTASRARRSRRTTSSTRGYVNKRNEILAKLAEVDARRRQPGLLGGARAEGRPQLRDRRDQEPRDLLRASRRRRRRARRRRSAT